MKVPTSWLPTVVRRAVFVLVACAVASTCKSSDSAGPACSVSAVAVLPPSATVVVGGTATLQTSITQTGCSTVAVQWQSANAGIATVSQAGVVTGVAMGGPVAITATAGGQTGSSSVTVTIPPVATVTIVGGRSNMLSGSTIPLSATTSDASGNALTGRTVAWSTSDASIATVSATGLVTGVVIGGPVTITATSEGKTATQVVNVNGRVGYAVVSNPGAATPVVDASTSFNASGLPITVTKLATGQFRVIFAGLNRLSSTTQKDISIVNAVGPGNAACASAGWGPIATTDLFADLQCTSAGVLADASFSIMILGNDAFGGRTAFTLADTPAATSPYNGPFTWTFNAASAAFPAVITRLSTGMYTVAFTNDGRVTGSNPETFLVSSRDPAATCQVQIWTLATATVTVKCVDVVAGTTLRDAQFHVALIDRGRPNMRAAFAWSDCGAVSCTPNATYRYSSASTTPTVDHTSLGVYVVHFPGLTRPPGGTDIVFVSAYGTGVMCKAVSWANAASGTELTANVQCFGGGFSLADALFDILLVQ